MAPSMGLLLRSQNGINLSNSEHMRNNATVPSRSNNECMQEQFKVKVSVHKTTEEEKFLWYKNNTLFLKKIPFHSDMRSP